MTVDDKFFRGEPGWSGLFTRARANGAWENGTRIVKDGSETDDAHKDGAKGTVLGSLSHPDVMGGRAFYFVEWDSHPRAAVGVMALKLKRADDLVTAQT